MSKYYKENKASILKKSLKYYDENRERLSERNAEKYYSNVKKSRKKQNTYYQKNKVHLAAEEKKRYWKEREVRCERTAKYYDKNKKQVAKRIKKYRKAKPEVQLRSQKKRLAMESKVFNTTSVSYVYALMAWKKVIINRDGRKCCYCNAKGKKAHLEGHHIIYKHTEMRLALTTNNGVILCRSCHDEVHKLNPIRFVRPRA
tara:strand:+ start:1108 stop:1710 length:603 start_codon:yes stop_codon:yes gene_type:complete